MKMMEQAKSVVARFSVVQGEAPVIVLFTATTGIYFLGFIGIV
jgi:hypothetical protein